MVSVLPQELQEACVEALRQGTLLSPVAPKALLRRLITETSLALSYPDSLLQVSVALAHIAEAHPLSMTINEDGSLDMRDPAALASKPVKNEKGETWAAEGLDEPALKRPKRNASDLVLREQFMTYAKPFVEICQYSTRKICRQAQPKCDKVHFTALLQAHTDLSLGHCSFLNTCYRPEACRYVHYEIEDPDTFQNARDIRARREAVQPKAQPNEAIACAQLPAQWLDCDVRTLDMSALGKFEVLMADPPWDIHQSLPYGTMTDDEMKALPIPALQDVGGLLFLWVTGRALDLGRDCLNVWGYQRIDEIIWVKTNQLQRVIRTGRTGHWLNHSKEHCLVAYKKPPRGSTSTLDCLAGFQRGFDCDVLVSEVRETSRKPDEMYGVIERACPGGRKLELFGRMHNTHPGWLTLGNQLGSSKIYEPDVVERLIAGGYDKPLELSFVPV